MTDRQHSVLARADDALPADLAAIVIRAGQLGFAPARVATALGISPRALASIDLTATSASPPPYGPAATA